jgi:outer membrane protein TolC
MRIHWISPLFVCLCAGQTFSLEAALEQAAKQNPGVQVARLRVLERQAQAAATKAAYLPQAEVLVSGAYQTNNLQGIGLVFPGLPDRLGPYRTFNARPVVTQKVMDFSLVSSIRASRRQAAAAKLDVEAVREETQAAVVALYLQTLQAESRVRAAKARLETADALLQQVTEREKSGAASQLDVARNRQQREAEQVVLIGAEQELAQLKPALAELLGGAYSGELVEPKLVMAAEGTRPDVQAAEERVRAAEEELARARRQRWPQLGVSGDYGVLGAGPDRSLSTYSVGATLSVPVWTSGRLESEIRAAAARVEQAKEEVRRLQLAAVRAAEQAVIGHASQTRAAAAAAGSAAAARQVLALARLRYESGLATAVDTVTAQGALAEAEEAEIRARYEASIALARLAYARGSIRSALR